MKKIFKLGVSWSSTFIEIEADNIFEAKTKIVDRMTQEEKESYCDIYELD